jgi:uncharacterized protein (TIGR04255 family)
MQNFSSALPDFEYPPVNEVVFGIQFKKLENLKAPDTGILWEKFNRQRYPECQEMPPIAHTVESFAVVPSEVATLKFEEFTRPPLPRLFFINEIKNHLIQVQQDRFHQNWRKLKPGDEYPRFTKLYPKFIESWEVFNSFVKELNLGGLEPDQYELSYVNHIPRGSGWENLSDIENVFPEFQCRLGDRFLPEPENVSWRKIYRLPNDKGRLHVSTRLAISRETNNLLIIMDLTVRGFVKNEMNSWFDMAHEWIVRGFTDLTGEAIQKSVWRRKR